MTRSDGRALRPHVLRSALPGSALYTRLYTFVAARRLDAHDVDPRAIRIHLVATLSTSSLMWAFACLAWWTIESPVPGLVGFACSVLHLLSPLLFRRSSTVWLVAAAMMAPGLLHQCTFAYFTGGYASNILVWLPIHPVLGGLIAGRLAALGWSLVSGLITLAALIADRSGYPFPHQITPAGALWAQGLLVFGWIFLALSLIWMHLSMAQAHESALGLKNRNIHTLLRILTHDVATPVGSIRLLLHRLRDAPPDQQEERLRHIESACALIEDMVRSVQRPPSLDRPTLSGPLQRHRLSDSLEFAARTLDARLEQKRQRLRYDPHALSALEVRVDPVAFDQHVLLNVLTNAMKFSAPDTDIQVRASSSVDQVHLSILDHGPGMPADVLQALRLGERPLSATGTQGEAGHGLGLLIVMSLMDELAGSIHFCTHIDEAGGAKGSEVVLSLPVARS